jgi:hypothetical protein
MRKRSRRGRVVQQVAGAVASLFIGLLFVDAMSPRAADAMCCACRTCPGAAFCVDGVNTSLLCAGLCVTSGCGSTVFDAADTCEGGCDGAPVAPTATVSSTPTITATASQTATATPTLTPTVTPGLAGQIAYYVDNRPVNAANVTLTAGTTAATVTDANGEYGFSSVDPGAQRLDVTKLGDFNVAITALDGAFVLEFVAGQRVFTADQRLAADVTGDGTISALDGTRILQLAAGIITRFAVSVECESDWLFRPSPAVVPGQTVIQPVIDDFMCTRGAIEYDENFAPPAADQNFVGILFGDTTGNWEPDEP